MNIDVNRYIRRPVELEGFQIQHERDLELSLVKWSKTDHHDPKIGDWVVFNKGSFWLVPQDEFYEMFRNKPDPDLQEDDDTFTVKGNIKFDKENQILYNANGENCSFKFTKNGKLIDVFLSDNPKD